MFKRGFVFGLGMIAAKVTGHIILIALCRKVFTDEEYLEAFGHDKKGNKPASE